MNISPTPQLKQAALRSQSLTKNVSLKQEAASTAPADIQDGFRDGVKWTASVSEDQVVHQKASPLQKLTALVGWGATAAIGVGLVAGGALATPLAAGLTVGAAVGSFFATDIASGLVHHFLDNIDADAMQNRGGAVAKFAGRIARDFQNHHSHTRDMVHRDYANHTWDTAKITTPILLGLAGAAALATPLAPLAVGPVIAALATVANLAQVAQEAHKCSHMSDEENPAWVRGLQKAGVFVSQDVHNAHHTEGHKSHYALLNGLTNTVLDGVKFQLTADGPQTNLLRKLEVGLWKMQGTEPNAWLENPGLKEEALGLK